MLEREKREKRGGICRHLLLGHHLQHMLINASFLCEHDIGITDSLCTADDRCLPHLETSLRPRTNSVVASPDTNAMVPWSVTHSANS